MANPRDDRETPGEDLFDDLDKFFAPIEETDWPEPEVSAPPPARRAGRAPAKPPQEEPDDADLFPAGWGDSLEAEADEGLLEAAASPAPESLSIPAAEDLDDTSAYEFSLGDGDEDDSAEALSPPAASQPPSDDRAWRGGGEGEEEESFLFHDEPSAAPPPSEEPPGELTLDDLKVAPPEYANLPGPAESATSPSSIFGDEDDSIFRPPRPPSQPPPEPPPASDATTESIEAPALAGTFEDEPSGRAADAADVFAEGMRTSREDVQDDLLAGLDSSPATTPRTVKVGSDEPVMGAGPAWEDPTSHAVVGEGAAPSQGGRNLSAALISGVALGALALILLAAGAAPFAYLAAAVLLAAQAELYAVARTRGYQPATALGLVIGGLTLYAAYNKGEVAMGSMLILGTMLSFLWYMAAPVKSRKGTLANIAVTILGVLYVPFFAGFIFRLLPIPGGRALVIWIIGLTVVYDVFAFGIGSLWGHRPLAPTISPNKSWEGTVGASLITLLVAIAGGPNIDPFKNEFLAAFGLGLVVLVAAPLGDLAESALKRDLGVKDMSTIMPGHGGLMDRIDSLLFVLPAAYLFLRVAF